MSSCQKDIKCQVVKHMDYRGGLQKKINWHNEFHTYWCQFWCHIWWWSKTLKMCIESVFEQFWWPSYLTSKLTSICVNLIMSIYLFVNLLHSLCVWLFDIWHLSDIWHLFDIWRLFDILTSFWHFDIFLNLNHLSPSQGYFCLSCCIAVILKLYSFLTVVLTMSCVSTFQIWTCVLLFIVCLWHHSVFPYRNFNKYCTEKC